MIRVLLVDDHEVVRAGLRMWLEDEPDLSVVGEAATAQEAIQKVRETQPNVVVMDLRLPDQSGLQAIRQLREEFPHLGIVILSSYANERFLTEALNLRVNAYVLKETGSNELLRAVRAAAQGEHLLTRASIPALLNQHQPIQASEDYPFASLSAREMEILALVAQGLTNKEIGQKLYLSEGTVRNYISSIMEKLGMRNRVELATYALRHNIHDWIPPLEG